MAALVLSAAGAAAGGAVFGPVGAIAGRLVGALAGNVIDQRAVRQPARTVSWQGPRLSDLEVMASTEGAPIPRVYGRARLAGQVIWATKLEEVVSTTSQTSERRRQGRAAGRRVTRPRRPTPISPIFAVGLCEGPIGAVVRIWADGKPLDLSGLTMRIYPGGEDADARPADRRQGRRCAGLSRPRLCRVRAAAAGEFRQPHSATLVRDRAAGRPARADGARGHADPGHDRVRLRAGDGRADARAGQSAPENRHVAYAPSDVDGLARRTAGVCPNLERVAIVVAWFGNDLRAGQCARACRASTIATKQTYRRNVVGRRAGPRRRRIWCRRRTAGRPLAARRPMKA